MTDDSQQLGRYELVKRIATGGMGVIYLAKSRGAAGFEKTVIIKKILDHLAEEEEFVTKFCDEGRIVVNLSHGNIVPVFDMGEEDGEYFIAMDYVPGRDLRAVLARLDEEGGRLPVHLAVHIASEVCKGLDYAHRKTDESGEPLEIVHRDVSPSNILISREGEVKIIDFGIARAASRAAKTVSGRIQGKVCYMSPEQAQAKKVDHRSDIFSTGVVLYEMLTGVRPFEGESDLQSLDLVRQCEFEKPSELNPRVPAEIDAIVERALARDVEERYPSIDQMHVELLEWLYSGKSAVTSQNLADFVHEVFPEGIERRELRQARESSSRSGAHEDEPKNLDEALNAELERLMERDDKLPVDPLSPTAPDGGQALESETPALDRTATLSDGPEGATDDESSAPKQRPDATDDEDGPPAGEEATDTADAVPAESVAGERTSGFKRWIAIAAGVGLLLGAVGLYLFSRGQPGTVEIETEPSGASISVDGARVSGAETPHTFELEPGRHTIELTRDGFETETFEHVVEPGEERRLDGRTIALNKAEESNEDDVRRSWVTVTPDDATLRINGRDKAWKGKTRLEVERGEQVLVEAEHPDCEKRTEFVTFEEAKEGVRLELDCEDGTAAASDDDDEDRDPPEEPSRPKAAAPSPEKTAIRFRTDPPGGQIRIDRKPVEEDQPVELEVGRTVDVQAHLDGYETVDESLEVDRKLDGRFTVELEEKPTGCLIVRPEHGQLAELSVDGESRGETDGEKIDVPAGKREITLEYGDGTTQRSIEEVAAGQECRPVEFDGDQPRKPSAETN